MKISRSLNYYRKLSPVIFLVKQGTVTIVELLSLVGLPKDLDFVADNFIILIPLQASN